MKEKYRQAIQGKATVKIPVVRLNHIGLPRSGKTYFRRRLRRDIRNIVEALQRGEKVHQPSTGVAESSLQIILRPASSEIGTYVPSKGWSVHDSLKDEAKMIKELICHITKTSSLLGDQLEVKEEDIDEIFSLLIKNSGNLDSIQLKQMLDGFTLVINSDTGGHAEFLDLHGALVSGPSLNLLFRRLTDKLDSTFNFSFTNKAGISTAEKRSTLTVEEVIFQSLASIASFSSTDPTRNATQQSSKVLIVGSYRDQVSYEEFKKEDQHLQEKIKSTDFYDKSMVLFAAENQLMLEVDNFFGNEEEVDGFQKVLERAIKQNFKEIEIPIAWLILSFCIRSKEMQTISLESCERLAKKLNIGPEDLQIALWFLHHCVGLLLYYPEIEELKDTVICDIQVVFDSASNLINNTFTFNNVGQRAYEEFKQRGRFSEKDLDAVTSNQTSVSFSLKKLVLLLEHLNILTRIPDNEMLYFMPCILESARANELAVPCRDCDPAPLMLRYECGYAPVGVFPAMITNLASQQKVIGWHMIEEGLRKNRVQFTVGGDYDILTLISHPRYFKFVLSRSDGYKLPNKSVCNEVLTNIESTLHTVTSHMNSTFSMGYKFGFECSFHSTKEHLCIVANKRAWRMQCVQDPKQSFPLEVHQKDWFATQIEYRGKIRLGILPGVHIQLNKRGLVVAE